MAQVNAAIKLKHLIGTCMPCLKKNAVKIQVSQYEFDSYIHMYFKKYEYIFAHDPNGMCKNGDIVLVQSLPEKLTRLISHKVVEVIYPLGNITDPVTGKKVAGTAYRDNIKEINKIYGETENAFDYDKAPPRGYLEDSLDFTHKPSYKKYYEDPDDPQPYAV